MCLVGRVREPSNLPTAPLPTKPKENEKEEGWMERNIICTAPTPPLLFLSLHILSPSRLFILPPPPPTIGKCRSREGWAEWMKEDGVGTLDIRGMHAALMAKMMWGGRRKAILWFLDRTQDTWGHLIIDIRSTTYLRWQIILLFCSLYFVVSMY